jgi:hypothetical protein
MTPRGWALIKTTLPRLRLMEKRVGERRCL